MALNYNSLGEHITFDLGTSPSSVHAGDFVVKEKLCGVALNDAYYEGSNYYVVAAIRGVWNFYVLGAYGFGKPVFYKAADGSLTFTSAEGLIPIGVAVGKEGNVTKVLLGYHGEDAVKSGQSGDPK